MRKHAKQQEPLSVPAQEVFGRRELAIKSGLDAFDWPTRLDKTYFEIGISIPSCNGWWGEVLVP